MSTFSEMCVPILQLTIKAYEKLRDYYTYILINKDSSFIDKELIDSLEKEISSLGQLIAAAKEELKKQKS